MPSPGFPPLLAQDHEKDAAPKPAITCSTRCRFAKPWCPKQTYCSANKQLTYRICLRHALEHFQGLRIHPPLKRLDDHLAGSGL